MSWSLCVLSTFVVIFVIQFKSLKYCFVISHQDNDHSKFVINVKFFTNLNGFRFIQISTALAIRIVDIDVG